MDSLRCSRNSISLKRLFSASSTKPIPSSSGVSESVSKEKKHSIAYNSEGTYVFSEKAFLSANIIPIKDACVNKTKNASTRLANSDPPKTNSINPLNQAANGPERSIISEYIVQPSTIFSPTTRLFNSGYNIPGISRNNGR